MTKSNYTHLFRLLKTITFPSLVLKKKGVFRTPKFRNYATALSGALLRLNKLPFKK